MNSPILSSSGKLPTQSEIVARINERKEEDFLGFEVNEYLSYLSFDNARQFLVEDATADKWNQLVHTRENVVKQMHDYMSFAWEKANNFRGISASRSISHYVAWTWLAGDYEFSQEIDCDYEFYGKPTLVKICERYGWDSKQWDDGVRRNSESD